MPDRAPFELRPAIPDDAAAILEVLTEIIAERRYLNSDAPPDAARFASFVRANLQAGAPLWVAEANAPARPEPGITRGCRLLGWCDVLPTLQPSRRHCGRIGMGVSLEWRGRGVGRRLLENVIRACWQAGYLRLELEVFTDNLPAIRLYQSLGFIVEGEHQRVRQGPTGFQNTYSMALLR